MTMNKIQDDNEQDKKEEQDTKEVQDDNEHTHTPAIGSSTKFSTTRCASTNQTILIFRAFGFCRHNSTKIKLISICNY